MIGPTRGRKSLSLSRPLRSRASVVAHVDPGSVPPIQLSLDSLAVDQNALWPKSGAAISISFEWICLMNEWERSRFTELGELFDMFRPCPRSSLGRGGNQAGGACIQYVPCELVRVYPTGPGPTGRARSL